MQLDIFCLPSFFLSLFDIKNALKYRLKLFKIPYGTFPSDFFSSLLLL